MLSAIAARISSAMKITNVINARWGLDCVRGCVSDSGASSMFCLGWEKCPAEICAQMTSPNNANGSATKIGYAATTRATPRR